MKTALIVISLISLVSFFTLSQMKTTESLRSDNPYCYNSVVNFGAKTIQVTNSCKTNEIIQFSVTAVYPDKTQQLNFETQCLQPGESQVFQLDIENLFGTFTQNVIAQTEC